MAPRRNPDIVVAGERGVDTVHGSFGDLLDQHSDAVAEAAHPFGELVRPARSGTP